MVFPFILLAHDRYRQDTVLLNHERFHFRQALELLVVGLACFIAHERDLQSCLAETVNLSDV